MSRTPQVEPTAEATAPALQVGPPERTHSCTPVVAPKRTSTTEQTPPQPPKIPRRDSKAEESNDEDGIAIEEGGSLDKQLDEFISTLPPKEESVKEVLDNMRLPQAVSPLKKKLKKKVPVAGTSAEDNTEEDEGLTFQQEDVTVSMPSPWVLEGRRTKYMFFNPETEKRTCIIVNTID
ncbi:unnamed protein product [Owenia fusiformis]|uniref:Uncharacterized protein n=1 Tax=Owenia fusiformis TaxID=6347 RepID=A0A8J1U4H6_OWEFU|nr:unnamed protein product [Owenia fusiformis]